MEIKKHPAWKNVSGFKKPLHSAKFFIAKNMAALYPRSHFVAISGSVGKTTTKQLSLAILSQKYKTIATDDNLDSFFNIPKTLLNLRPHIQKVILEVDSNSPGEADFFLSLVRPSTAVLTRISYFQNDILSEQNQTNLEEVKVVKQLPKDGFAILNWDDLFVRRLAEESQAQVIFYGTDPKNCHVWADKVKIEKGWTYFELNYGVERVGIELKLLGKQFITDALAAASLGISLGISLFNIKKALEKVDTSLHKMQLLEGLGSYLVLDDTYSSSPLSLIGAVDVLTSLPSKRKIAVLGEMKDIGVYSEELHRSVAQEIYKNRVDYLLLGPGDTKFLADELIKLGFPAERIDLNLTNPQMVSKILGNVGKGDLVLVKGSWTTRLDEVVKRITRPNNH